MLKHLKSPLFLALAMLLLLAGCTGPDRTTTQEHLDPKTPVMVTLWHYYVGENQQELDGAVSEFNRSIGVEKGVVVEAVAMGSISKLEEQITNSAKGVINSRPLPQIFSSYPDKAMELDSYDVLVDLSEYFLPEEKALYVPDFLSDGTFEGDRLLTLPIVKSTELMYINQTDWKAFAAEMEYTVADLASWEGVYQTARAYYQWTDSKTPDVPWDGMSLMGFDSVANYIIVGSKQLGVDMIDSAAGEAGRAVLDRQALRRIFDIYYQGIGLGYFGADGKFRSDDVKAGSMISYVGSSASAAYFPAWIERDNTQVPIEFLALPYPVFGQGADYAIQQGAGMCVTKSTPAQQEGAALFLKWFTQQEQNIPFAMSTGYLPVQTAAYASPLFDEALSSLRSGQGSQQNVAAVYEIALKQITQSHTYAASPFPGSYDVRSILQSTLIAVGEKGMTRVQPLMEQGATEEEIMQKLSGEVAFEEWLQQIQQALLRAGVQYQVT